MNFMKIIVKFTIVNKDNITNSGLLTGTIKFFPFWSQCLLPSLLILHFVRVHEYADLLNFYANNAPQTTIPSDILITSYCPNFVIFNFQLPFITLLELTCPLDSTQHIQAAQNRKQNKVECRPP